MVKLKSYCEPIPNSPGIEGHGEGVMYDGKVFFYRCGKHIPSDKAVSLVWEGNFAGRVRGDKEYIIVLRHNEEIYLLEWYGVFVFDLNKKVKAFNELTPELMIQSVLKKEKEQKDWADSLDKCSQEGCENHVLLFHDEQPIGVCYGCFIKGTTKPEMPL